MATRRTIDKKTYEALTRAFADSPNVHQAAKAAKCSWGMAKKAWEQGWPERFPWARPIREVIEAVHVRARTSRGSATATASPMATAPPEFANSHELVSRLADLRAKEDAARTREEEALLVAEGRQVALGMAGSLQLLMDAMQPLARGAALALHDLAEEARTKKDGRVDPAAVLGMLQDLGNVAQQLGGFGRTVMELERKRLGQPEKHVGVSADFGRMSEEELRAAAQERLERLQGMYGWLRGGTARAADVMVDEETAS